MYKIRKISFTMGGMAMAIAPALAAISCAENDGGAITIAVKKEHVKGVADAMASFTKRTNINVKVIPLPQTDSKQGLASNIQSWYASGSTPDIFVAPADLGVLKKTGVSMKVPIKEILSQKKYFLDDSDKNISDLISWQSLDLFKDGQNYLGVPLGHNVTGFAYVKDALKQTNELKAYVPNPKTKSKWLINQQATNDIANIPGIKKETDGKVLATPENVEKFIQAAGSNNEQRHDNWYGKGFSSQIQRIYSVIKSAIVKSDSSNISRGAKFIAPNISQMNIPFSGILDMCGSKFSEENINKIDSDLSKREFNNQKVVDEFATRLYNTKFGYVDGETVVATQNIVQPVESTGVAEALSAGWSNSADSIYTWQRGLINGQNADYKKAKTAINVTGVTRGGNTFEDLSIVQIPYMSQGFEVYGINRDLKGERQTNVYKVIKFLYSKSFQKYMGLSLVPFNSEAKIDVLGGIESDGYKNLLQSGNTPNDVKYPNGNNYPAITVDNLSTQGANDFWWGRYYAYVNDKVQKSQADMDKKDLDAFKTFIWQLTQEFQAQDL